MSSNKNRFWAASSSDDESYSDSSYSDSSEVEAPKKTAEKSKYVVISESESEEEKRVVKSPKCVVFASCSFAEKSTWTISRTLLRRSRTI